MVYDPINGCVRGLPPFRTLDIYEEKEQTVDRVDQMEELAEASFGKGEKPPLPIKRGRLRFMIGLQRSGKSTWATHWSRQTPRTDKDGVVFPRAIVCADNIRLAISGERYNKYIEPITFMVKDYMIEALLSRGHDVLVDGTHTTKFSIRQVLKIDPEAHYTLINTPIEECKRRAVATGQPDLVPVLDRTGRQLAALLDEGIPQICETLIEEIKRKKDNNAITEK